MFCTECGHGVEESEKFCSNCGTSTLRKGRTSSGKAPPSVDLNTPVITARPIFIPWVTVASVLPIQIFMTVWAGGFFGGFGLLLIEALGLNLPQWFPFLFCSAAAFFGIPYMAYFTKKKTYSATSYNFYPDRLEYSEGFWTIENKIIKYRNITEINLRKGVAQKKYGLGTIVLSTPATSIQQGRHTSGIRISDISNAEEIYMKVQDLIG